MTDRKQQKHEYYLANKDKMIACSTKWRKDNREHSNDLHRISRKKEAEKIVELLGKICSICGNSKRRIQYHEIHGKPHTKYRGYIIKHYKDFTPLCCRCHNVLHYLFNLNNVEEMFKLLKKLIKCDKNETQ